jgi:two-component system LytT family sensor kinase
MRRSIPTRTGSPERLSWKLLVLGWGVYATYMSVASYVVSDRLGKPVSWSRALAGDFSYSAIWLLLTPLVLWIAARVPFERGKLWSRGALHLALSILLAMVHKAVHNVAMAGYFSVTEGAPFSWDLQYRNIWAYFDYGIQLYWIILLFKFAYEYYVLYQDRKVKAAELEAELAQAQLQALRMQLQPHFLFNTLNAISVLIQKDPPLARKTLGLLSDLLRSTLDLIGVQYVTLRSELEFLNRYLQIEQTRFGDRLVVEVNPLPDTLDALVPNMILQPLVENSIKHGMSQVRGATRIAIGARRGNGRLILQVNDNGPGLETQRKELREGLGLATTRERLLKMYGDEQSFDLAPGTEGGASATVTIPFQTALPGGEAP